MPDDVSVSDNVAEELSATLPKLKLVVLKVSCGLLAVPVPLKATTAELPVDELLVIVSCPLTAPAAFGVNVTDIVNDWLGFSVTGNVPATTLKAAPFNETVFTVTGVVPEDRSVSDCVDEVFTAILPKLKLLELNVNCGFDAPVPLKDTTAADALLAIVSCPLADPAAVGVNVTGTVSVWFGFSVTGNVPATTLKAAPLNEIALTVNGAVPVDVSVNDCVAELFTATLPKFRLEELSVNCGVVGCCEAVKTTSTQ